MGVIRRVLVLQLVARGPQGCAGVIPHEDLRLGELRGDEVGREETKESGPEQHGGGWAVAKAEATWGNGRDGCGGEEGILRAD